MDQNPKQAIVEKIKSASSVLVTVSTNPSVDQLSAALGLTLMLSALDVKSTAVFSGDIPNVLEFLDPEKTFNKDVNALRDFIVSIDKDKADKLRYKVEDDVVRIYITPYKTTLSEADLAFSQGDINVDLVIALGVHNKGDLDQAIVSHGRILHDATIASITAGADSQSELGAINWFDPGASSLSEMLVSISEALKSGVLDKSMSTAFLTGIVAATERFSNEKTSPKVMTMAAQLMAAGADQQIIAKNLRMDRGRTTPRPEVSQPQPEPVQEDPSVLDLHKEERQPEPEQKPETLEELENEFDHDQSGVPELHEPEHEEEMGPEVSGHSMIKGVKPLNAPENEEEPKLGGTFNATSQAAHEASEEEKRRGINHEILTHGAGEEPAPPLESAQEPAVEIAPPEPKEEPHEPLPPPPPVIDPIEEARKAVSAAVEGDADPAHHPRQDVGASPLENAATDVQLNHQINIDPSGNINTVGDQPTQPTENPVEQRAQAAAPEEQFSLPTPAVGATPAPQPAPIPEPEPTLPPQPPTPHVQHDSRHMVTAPPSQQESSSELPLGVTKDDEDKPVGDPFLITHGDSGQPPATPPPPGPPSAPPPLPPNPTQPPQPPQDQQPPQNPLFNQ